MGGTSWLGTLLGPEDTGASPCGGVGASGGRLRAVPPWVVAVGWSVGCLRTVQWTRASLISIDLLWSSF